MKKSVLFGFGLVVTMLVTLGFVVLSSASEANALRLHGDVYFFIKRQAAYLVVGILVAVAVAKFDYRNWREHPSLAFAVAGVVFLLLLAVFLGRPINGSYRWIIMGPLRLQPSEFAKVITVILLAVILDRSGWRVELFRQGALYPAIVIGVLVLPIIHEPDFGSTMVVAAAGGVLMLVAGTRIRYLSLFMVLGFAGFAVKVLTNANRMARLLSFFNVSATNEGMDAAAKRAAYQVGQALIAIKNGGLWGVGLGESMQKHYYLPEAHTDFIFAVGAEELGILFSIGVLVLFTAFLILSIHIAKHAADRFGRYLVVGMTFIIFFQAMFNLGVVCKALPTKGIALPFFSYGGTNLISAFIAVGTILSVGIHSLTEGKRLRPSVLC